MYIHVDKSLLLTNLPTYACMYIFTFTTYSHMYIHVDKSLLVTNMPTLQHTLQHSTVEIRRCTVGGISQEVKILKNQVAHQSTM